MYQQAVVRLMRAADQVAEYRIDLAAFADILAGKRWGVDVTGPVQDMDTRLAAIEGAYRDLAAQMRHQGDQGAGAYDQAPWVPDNLLGEELHHPTAAGSAGMGEWLANGPDQPGRDATDDHAAGDEDVLDLVPEHEEPAWTDQLVEDARQHLAGVKFDTLVGTGTSGAVAVPVLARTLGVHFVVVRKPDELAQSNAVDLVAGRMGRRWVFVDDFMESGASLRRVQNAVQDEVLNGPWCGGKGWHTTYVGTYLYYGEPDPFAGTPRPVFIPA